MVRPDVREVRIQKEEDLLHARQAIRELSTEMGFGLVDQTRLVTAVSELTRNAFKYAGGGVLALEHIERNGKTGIRVTVTDHGPGIADIELAMTAGYSSSNGLGHGLSGSKRLMDGLEIQSKVGEGTKVVAVKWM
ncbi:MAG: anti-sigma regulatory factor [Planctomycetes bacterium]|nr:anti-sigma regulatory factor [Planctomycetota bacterium]MBL7040198.1 anti-sigma regulatory factor [Pirellulaceae bacterium]